MDLGSKDLMPLPLSDFTKGVRVPVDVYIRLGEENFVLVWKAGTINDPEQFKNYEAKEVSYVWVLRKDYFKLAHQAVSLAGVALSNKDMADSKRTVLVTMAARSLFRQVENQGVDLELYSNAQQVTEAVVGLMETHKTFGDLFASLATFSDQLLAHSVSVSFMSVLLGTKLGYEKKTTLEKLALAGLLHDVGLKALPAELVQKPMASMTSEEILLFETHSYRGQQMLTSLGVVPEDIVSMVYEHHENSIGQGYPQRIRDVKIHPMAKIIALADAYSTLTLANVNCPTPKSPREAIMHIEHTLGIPYNREAFRALKRIIEGDDAKKTG